MVDYNPRYHDSVFQSYFNDPARLVQSDGNHRTP